VKAPIKNPMVMRVMGRIFKPIFRRPGYTNKSTMGIKMMRVMGLILVNRSFGNPSVRIYVVMDWRLESIWPYVIQ
jgi:hypothetical protein